MNKTTFKPVPSMKREVLTQGNFYRRPTHSPIRSQKSFDDAAIKTELMINKQYRKYAFMQPLPPQIGASSIRRSTGPSGSEKISREK